MKHCSEFYGSTTVGKKGQIVIPMETRKKMKWTEGEKLLVFGLENGMVVLTKLDQVEQFAARVEKKMELVRKHVKKSK